MALKVSSKGYIVGFTSILMLLLGFLGVAWPLTHVLALALAVYLSGALGYVRQLSVAVEALEISRVIAPSNSPEGTRVRVGIRITNRSRRWLKGLIVRDYPPARVAPVEEPEVVTEVSPRSSTAISYTVIAYPGVHEFSELELELSDPLGLYTYTRSVRAPALLRSSPAESPSVEVLWRTESLGMSEVYSRLHRGVGLEFFEIREYQPGDDVRRIVWSATARTGSLMVREDLKELRPKVFLFIDLSRDSWLGEPGSMPGDYIMRASAATAAFLARVGGVMGFTIYDGNVWRVVHSEPASITRTLLADRLSSFAPESSTHRMNLEGALKHSSLHIDGGLFLIYSGPGFLRGGNLRLLASEPARFRGRTTVMVFLPGGRGLTARSVRRLEEKYYGEMVEDLAKAGVRAYLAYSPAAIREALKNILVGVQAYA